MNTPVDTVSGGMDAHIRTAVILAAGMGTRLERLWTTIPKGFLRFGDRPIVEESIAKLHAVGITRIVIVTGHLHAFYDELRTRYPALITTVHNGAYARSGSMYSLWCAREQLRGDFLLLESDILYEGQALSALLASPEENAVLLTDEPGSHDPVYVETTDGLLVTMSKDRSLLQGGVSGELVGISKISRTLFATMTALVEEALPERMAWHYEQDGLVAAARLTPVHGLLVPRLTYCEIDDAEGIATARSHAWRQIVERDRNWRTLTPPGTLRRELETRRPRT